MVEWLWNLLFPPKCPGCNGYVEHQGQWCNECLARVCRPHLLPLDREMTELFLGGIWALGLYEGELRNMLRQLKYQQKQVMVPGLHNLVAEGIGRIPTLWENLVAVPVPLNKAKLAQRGFNQSKLIFQKPLADYGIAAEDWLIRTKATKPQYGLSGVQRRKNLHQVFELAGEKSLQGKRILLVDDIMTTGATLLECGRVLKKAGAVDITGLVVASGRK